MHIRNHAQRKHIIDSLEALLYQLAVLSFLMSPSILALVARTAAQFQLSKPREMDAGRTLRFWYFLIFFFNFGSLWAHIITGAEEGRAVVLDFIGMSFTPSKLQLLFLDLMLLSLSIILVTIAYDTAYVLASRGPIIDPLTPASYSAEASISDPTSTMPTSSSIVQPPLVLDFHLSNILTHLRNPLPPIESGSPDDGLPMPNTASMSVPRFGRMLWERRRHNARTVGDDERSTGSRRENGARTGTIPGDINAVGDAT